MDRYLFFLLIFGFAGLIIFGFAPLDALILIVFFALVYVGIRYPHTRDDWPMDRKETLRFSLLSGLGILFVVLLDRVKEEFATYSTNTICMAVIVVGFSIAIVAGLIFPQGLDSGEEGIQRTSEKNR